MPPLQAISAEEFERLFYEQAAQAAYEAHAGSLGSSSIHGWNKLSPEEQSAWKNVVIAVQMAQQHLLQHLGISTERAAALIDTAEGPLGTSDGWPPGAVFYSAGHDMFYDADERPMNVGKNGCTKSGGAAPVVPPRDAWPKEAWFYSPGHDQFYDEEKNPLGVGKEGPRDAAADSLPSDLIMSAQHTPPEAATYDDVEDMYYDKDNRPLGVGRHGCHAKGPSN